MAAADFYLGLSRGQNANIGNVVAGTASNGQSSDVELRIQTNNGVSATNITREDVQLLVRTILDYLNSPSIFGGIDLPAN